MSPYLTERMLRQSAALAPLGEIAVQHRERLDGSGYPRGLSGGAISTLARVLGAADAYQAMREPRPYRPARSAQDASAQMRAEVRAGRLDGAAVDAVLDAAGHRVPRRRTAVAGLTAREVEVLILLARGMSNKRIAASLVISPKTAGNHVEHIYAKIDATNRAAAAMFALQHGLLPEEEVALPRPATRMKTALSCTCRPAQRQLPVARGPPGPALLALRAQGPRPCWPMGPRAKTVLTRGARGPSRPRASPHECATDVAIAASMAHSCLRHAAFAARLSARRGPR